LGLKYLAEEMGISTEGRIVIPPAEMAEYYEVYPDQVALYCSQDVQETEALIRLMVQPEFYVTTMIPDTFQNVLLTGGGQKVNQLLCARYIAEKQSIPVCPQDRTDYQGGWVECRKTGVFRDILKADVSSLYPTIMLTVPGSTPGSDEIGAFRDILRSLTERRLAAKARAKSTTGETEKTYFTGIEKTYKILINSFYGYLACGMNFSDFEAASVVTQTGREIVCQMGNQLEAYGAELIEIDTDGIYFVKPDGFEPEWIQSILDLPEGVIVDIDTGYQAMVSVKAKNYVLQKTSGEKKFHGNSLRSRRDEGFGKEFITQVVDVLLDSHPEFIAAIYVGMMDKILQGKMSGESLAKRERITDKVMESDLKRRIREAMTENDAEGDYIHLYKKEDGSLAQVADYIGDYDRYHYWGRLHKFAQRLEPIIALYPDVVIEKPSKKLFKQRQEMYRLAA
jgi:DNA polymerase elongation subunit (family B)